VQLPPNPAQSRKKQVRRAKAALTAASFVVLPATSAFLAGFGTAHAVGGPGSVAGSVYLDTNRNSTQDSGEAGVDGIMATAYTTVGGVDTPIGSPAVTAGGGLYDINLTNVSAGDAIKVVFTNLGSNTAVSIGGAIQTATLATGSSGGVFTGIANLGVAPVTGVVIGDRVWIDTDGNGIQNANESPVPSQLTGISVELLEDGVGVATTLTDGNGYYLFVDSANGVSGPGIQAYAGFTAGKKYAVRVNGVSSTSSALSGYTNTLATVGAADADSNGVMCGTVTGTGTAPAATTCDPVSAEITLPAGAYSNTTVDFGFVPYDLEIAQVTTTPNVVAGGIASFDVVVTNRGPGPVQGCNIVNLLPAGLTYASPLAAAITATSANAGVVGIDPADASKLRIDCTTSLAVGAQVRFTVNAVVGASVTGPIKNFAYVTPPSTDAAAAETKPLGNPIPTNATDATSTVTLNDSQASVTVSAPAGTASLGDKVWIDNNNNGIQDGGDTAAVGVSAALYDATGTNPVGPTTVTDAAGMYGFTGLNAGTYTVKFGKLSGYTYTTQNAAAGTDANDSDANTTSGISDPVTIALGENNPTVDAGLVLIAGGTTASIGDTVWLDSNVNGVQDAGENSFSGVQVLLVDTVTGAILSTTTDITGKYNFANLPAGTYRVTFAKPTGYAFTTPNSGSDISRDSDADPTTGTTALITVGAGSQNDTIDAGLYLPASIGDQVWIDANGNGVQDAAETAGLAGVTVTLYDATGAALATKTTDANGKYLFGSLKPGTYSVGFTNLAGHTLTAYRTGTDAAKDSDAVEATGRSAAITIISGQNITDLDAGVIPPKSPVATTATNTATTTPTAAPSSTTAVPGTLPPGSVVVVSTPTSSTVAPAATTPTSSIAPSGSAAPSSTLKPGSPATPVATSPGSPTILDATCKVNSVVWIDTNGNGIVDAGEQVIPGVTVRVTAGGIVKEAVTDSLGRYSFVGIQCGDVTVEILSGLPAGTPLPAAKTIRVLGETAQAPLDVPFGVQLQTEAEVAFGGAESRQFFAAALTFLGMGGLLMSRKRKEANLRRH
jgi:large repetitive protein